MSGNHRIRTGVRVQGVTAWSMLVCSFKVILTGSGFLLLRRSSGRTVSVTCMISTRFRRPLMVAAAVLAVLSLAAVGTVMAMAYGGQAAPAPITSTALYGLPLAFVLVFVLVIDSIAARRRAGNGGGR